MTSINKYVKTNRVGKKDTQKTKRKKRKWNASFCRRKSQRDSWRDDVILEVKNPTVGFLPQEFTDHIKLMITVGETVVVNVCFLLSLVAANKIRVDKILRRRKNGFDTLRRPDHPSIGASLRFGLGFCRCGPQPLYCC